MIRKRRKGTFMVSRILFLIFVVRSLATVHGAEPPPAPAPAEDAAPAEKDVLIETYENAIKDKDKFREAVRRSALNWERLVGNDNLESRAFKPIALNKRPLVHEGVRFDGFSFRTPENDTLLFWAFRGRGDDPASPRGWYILPAEGEMDGFRFFRSVALDRDVPEVGKKGDHIVTQSLADVPLKPNSVYVIWFAFANDMPWDAAISLNLYDSRELLYLLTLPLPEEP
jgi:hypothetical protein